ncbi:damage-inducible protein CinA [Rhodovibrio sodomensis]|uniref:Damage-inducible protein CinA n=1 Tax=Rhodovibrio sodomensis TaxID=1088 RepID=A0ABS1DFP5_9PROT|nr:CinA family protein [Rhodovibrio sodomensis]MBK1668927.1 damage-inducible protein CinA [Rhodovibrio sodomensis]
MFPDDLRTQAERLLDAYKDAGWMLATAESCTGGLIAALLTEIPGSSAVVERGFVTYTNTAKRDMLGVPPATLDAHGAVSRQVAQAMAEGALARAPVDAAVAVTGVAGPSGGTAEKPVGRVEFALAATGLETHTVRHDLTGDRGQIRHASLAIAFDLFHRALNDARAS